MTELRFEATCRVATYGHIAISNIAGRYESLIAEVERLRSLHAVPEGALRALMRYERDVEPCQSGHYGEEQWTETVMRPCAHGAWVRWSDIQKLLS